MRPMFCAAALATAVMMSPGLALAHPLYRLTAIVPLGGGETWDYLHFDANSDRLFISHDTEFTVVDPKRDQIIGHVTGLHGSHGIAMDPASGLIYADGSGSETTSVFKARIFAPVKTIPAWPDADGMVFDPVSHQVFVVGGMRTPRWRSTPR